MEREYIVTLKNRDDLNSFYEDMETLGGTTNVPDREVELKERRAISRNTHYLLTDEEAEELRKDDRVLAVELTPEERGFKLTLHGSYNVSGNFDKTPDSNSDINWGILHCAGNQTQRRKGSFGVGQIEEVSDSVTVFNNGENVDVVIVDEPVAYDHQEFLDPDTNQTRFVQYQWYNELDQYMVGLDTQESDSDYQNFINSNSTNISYYNCSQLNSLDMNHGTHVAGTAVGKTQGWARKSNLYSMNVIGSSDTGSISSSDVISPSRLFDYLRAFHLYKPDNINTGKKNPTVTNHSWGYSAQVVFSDYSQISQVVYRGITYTNPNDGSWTENYIESNFGVQVLHNGPYKAIFIPSKEVSIDVDVQDAIEDGVIVISAAGNEYSYGVPENHNDYDNRIYFTSDYPSGKILQINGSNYNSANFYYHRGSSPGSADGSINVGNISADSDFKKNFSSNYGPIVNVFAPGTNIQSSVTTTTSSYDDLTGTSMASPQVAGIVSCFCSGKSETNNSRALQYIQDMGIDGDMTENPNGDFTDPTYLGEAPNLTAASRERRNEYPILSFNDLPRESEGVVYPRKKIGKKS